ncbi:hypothetical protein L596_025918 [Steinernema carpocapsae]|uniref:UvrD-like helicase C-terminal domain-containing protein n=1 Tax=Steinernema carpocapsae TaxID=34508 RepID=A0A4U5M960_STECR|nr:hypothetical protein L596_025918 [Steinernema carpocapsae]
MRDGLSNGTMLQIVGFSGELLKCRRLDNSRAYDSDVYLSRVKFQHGTGEGDRKIRFFRIQYPIRLVFAVTINKAQGQTLLRVGLYFRGEQCFSHGQLYVAFSRVKQHEAIKILNAAAEVKRLLRNVVFKELLMD